MQVHARYVDLSAPGPKVQPIELEIYEPDPDNPRCLRFVRMRTVGELYDELKARLEAEDLLPDDHLSIHALDLMEGRYGEERNIHLPQDYWRIIAFAVRGASEGHYIHVGVLNGGRFYNIILGKTLREGDDGMDFALKVAGACTKHMGC